MNKKNRKENTSGKSRKREILGILIICVSVFLLVALLTFDKTDPPGSSKEFGEQINNWTGRYGAFAAHYIFEWLGFTAYAFLIFMLLTGAVIFLHKKFRELVQPGIFLIVVGVFLPLLATLFIDIDADKTIPSTGYGGIFGVFLAYLLVNYLGRLGAFLISFAAILIAVVIATNLKPSTIVEFVLFGIKKLIELSAGLMTILMTILLKRKKRSKPLKEPKIKPDSKEFIASAGDYENEDPFLTPVEDETPVEPTKPTIRYQKQPANNSNGVKDDKPVIAGKDVDETDLHERDYSGLSVETEEDRIPVNYFLPTLDILDEPPETNPTESSEGMLEKAQRIVQSLKHFNIDSEVRNITPGPIVTRYELTLAPGVKVGRVVSLSDDLTMALRSKGGIRILAPIPGKAAIGIEVPNNARSIVYFRDIAESEAFQSSDQYLLLALGKNTAGEPIVADLAKMPHLLIAGSTGSGKSVCIHTIIASILLKAPPDKVRMIMVDPKVVELTIYNSIPHLLTPVITDTKQASEALKWAVREMEIRYRQLASIGVRDITQYNEKIAVLAEQKNLEENADIPKPYISNNESNRLTDFISEQPRMGVATVTEKIFREEPEEEENTLGLRDPNARDSLFFNAARLVVRNNQGSVSLLQRRLKIGYARAARLIDQLELASIVSPYDGSKAREVLVDDLYIDELEAGEL